MMNSNINYSDTDSEIDIDEEMSQVPVFEEIFEATFQKAQVPKFEPESQTQMMLVHQKQGVDFKTTKKP